MGWLLAAGYVATRAPSSSKLLTIAGSGTGARMRPPAGRLAAIRMHVGMWAICEHPQKLIMDVALDKTVQEYKMWGSMSRKPGQPSEYMGQIYEQTLARPTSMQICATE